MEQQRISVHRPGQHRAPRTLFPFAPYLQIFDPFKQFLPFLSQARAYVMRSIQCACHTSPFQCDSSTTLPESSSESLQMLRVADIPRARRIPRTLTAPSLGGHSTIRPVIRRSQMHRRSSIELFERSYKNGPQLMMSSDMATGISARKWSCVLLTKLCRRPNLLTTSSMI